MEDAVVLGNACVKTTTSRWRCGSTRRCAATAYATSVLKARKRCDVTHGKDMALTQARYQELKEETGERIINGLCETIQGGPLG